MSQTPLETINVSYAGDDQYPPQSAQSQAPHGVSDFVDGSGPISSMYLEMATEEDQKMIENWKADADGILIFTGLFSAAVASLISVSIQDIRPNPQDTSNFYLANIYRTIADPNGPSISSSLPTSPPPFTPPNYAVWVNALWFLSLIISLTCALLATLLQQWARRYLRFTQSRYSLHKRTRIRAFFAEGVEKLLLPRTVEILPTLLHISLFLFFAGLVVFLSNVNLTTFKLVLSWVGVCMALYGCITLMPIFHHDSPYHTPLSLPAWHIVTGISFVSFWVLQWVTDFQCFSDSAYVRFWNLKNSYRKFLIQGMQKTAEETALKSPSEIDIRAFMWTFNRLDQDHELERFFAGLPGLRSSKFVNYPLPSLTHGQRWELGQALTRLLDRTFTSDLLLAPVKNRRAIICAKAVDPAYIPHAFSVFDNILSNCQYGGPLAAGIVEIVRGWPNNTDEAATLYAQAILSMIIARVQPRHGSWFILASNELGIPETVLRDYAAHGDSLSLAILIHVVRQQLIHYQKWSWPRYEFWKVLEAASKFKGQDTSPTLQHKFCTLWNQIVCKVKNDNDQEMSRFILRLIRNVHIALHQDTDSPPTRLPPSADGRDDILEEQSSYTVCNAVGHIHDDSTSTASTCTVLHDSTTLASASLAGPDAPSLSKVTSRRQKPRGHATA